MHTAPLSVDGGEVGPVLVARTFLTRLRGMLGRSPLPDAMLLVPCTSVHGAGMRASLDVAFLARDGSALRVAPLHPWRALSAARGTRAVLEAPLGTFERWGLRAGSVVTVPGVLDAR